MEKLFNIYAFGYLANLLILGHMFFFLITSNSWTKGKRVVVAIVGALFWNYLWAVLGIIVDLDSLVHWRAFGYQIPNLILFIYAIKVWRS